MTNIYQHKIHSALSAPLYEDSALTLRSVQINPSQAVEARQQLLEAGRKFEAYFISYLLKVMRETVPEGVLANKQGAYFYSFYDEEIGMRAADAGGLGIAKMVQEYAQQYFSSFSPVRSSSPG